MVIDTMIVAVYAPTPPPGIPVPTKATDHQSTNHRQGMETAYTIVDEYKAQTHTNQSTEIVKTFTCAVGRPSEVWNWMLY